MLICIGGVCVPYTAVVPIIILALKWILEKFGLGTYLPQFLQDMLQVRGVSPPSSSSCCTDDKCCETTNEEAFTATSGPSKVQPLESMEELEDLLTGSKKVKVVCKFTSTWCVPCKKVQPFFEKCSGQSQYQKKKDGRNVHFRTIDVDEFEELSNKYKVSMMPTFVVLQGDKVLATYSGSNEHELDAFLKENAGSATKNDASAREKVLETKGESSNVLRKPTTTEAPAAANNDEETHKPSITTKAPPANDEEETRNPLVFPSFLAPPTTILSMPFAPFRKEDEGDAFPNLLVEAPVANGDKEIPREPPTEQTKKAETKATNGTVSAEEELNLKIAELGGQIAKAKQEKKPKEEWDPILKEMLALKAKFKEVTGKDHGPPKKEKKPKNSGQQEASEKNKAKRAAKAEMKRKREEEKERKRKERELRELEKAKKNAGVGQDNFGDAKMVQSHEVTDKKWVEVANLNPSLAGQKVLTRGYLQTSRNQGKGVFVLIRSTLYTVQGVAFQNKTISQGMIKYIAALPVESVVEVEGTVTVPDKPVEAATQKMVEIQITAFHCVSKAKQALPFLMEDACRPDETKEADVGAYDETLEVQREDGLVRVGDKNRLDHRWLDLRTPANQSIMRIESMVGCLFRECLLSKGFIELHAPKLIAGSSEGGADVFTLDYFGQPACLAMSPQLHKQMAAACSGFERVFTTGPVFRAENSNTRRHLCEFTGFDLEMAIHEHYDEVMDVFSDLFIHIFDGINERCKAELERIREQHPFEDLKYLRPTLKITYAEGCALLREAGIEQDDYEDLSTENEKKLGDIVKEKYDTDFFFMDKYPLSVRPFYTMPCPENPKLSNSYDFFIRGQEILSGAQRIHEPDFIEERAKAWGIDLSTIEEYVNSFRNGALPHGGGGIGLERVVMLFLGLPNIRKAAWFPRDPRRLAP